MRQYLFRGKIKDNSKWIYGSLIDEGQKAFIVDNSNNTITEVIPESIGQFINGYYEKTKEPIFEGDIVEAWSAGSKGTFVVRFRNEAAPTFILFPAWQARMFWSIHLSMGRDRKMYDDLKKIGTSFENPELLPNAN